MPRTHSIWTPRVSLSPFSLSDPAICPKHHNLTCFGLLHSWHALICTYTTTMLCYALLLCSVRPPCSPPWPALPAISPTSPPHHPNPPLTQKHLPVHPSMLVFSIHVPYPYQVSFSSFISYPYIHSIIFPTMLSSNSNNHNTPGKPPFVTKGIVASPNIPKPSCGKAISKLHHRNLNDFRPNGEASELPPLLPPPLLLVTSWFPMLPLPPTLTTAASPPPPTAPGAGFHFCGLAFAQNAQI